MLQGGMSRLGNRCRRILTFDLMALLVVLQHAFICGKRGIYTLFHENDMLRHIMQANKVWCDIEVVQRVLSISNLILHCLIRGRVLHSYKLHGPKYRNKFPYQAIHLKKEFVEDNDK